MRTPLKLEFTEFTVIEDERHVIGVLLDLKALVVRVSLDVSKPLSGEAVKTLMVTNSSRRVSR
jgi:hypothetical protein